MIRERTACMTSMATKLGLTAAINRTPVMVSTIRIRTFKIRTLQTTGMAIIRAIVVTALNDNTRSIVLLTVRRIQTIINRTRTLAA